MRQLFPLVLVASTLILLLMSEYEYKNPVQSQSVHVQHIIFTPSYGLRVFLEKDPAGMEFSRCKFLTVSVELKRISGEILGRYGFKSEVGSFYCWILHISSKKCKNNPCKVTVIVKDGRVLVEDYALNKRGYMPCLNYTKNITLCLTSLFDAISKVKRDGRWKKVENTILRIKRRYGGEDKITVVGTRACYFATDGFVIERGFNISIRYFDPLFAERDQRIGSKVQSIDELDFMINLAQTVEWRETAGLGRYIIVYATYYPFTRVLWVEVAEAYPVVVIKEFVFNL